jgi:hypothetical protein
MALVTREEVIEFAKIDTTLTGSQAAALDAIVAAVTPEIENITGPLELTTSVYRCGPKSGAIVLPWRYVSVTSVTVDGVTVDAALYDDVTRADRGILDAVNGSAPWASGQSVVVTAQVGSATTPTNVRLAALELASFWWVRTQQTQRQAWNGDVPMGFGIPQAVRDHLDPSPRLPGFA